MTLAPTIVRSRYFTKAGSFIAGPPCRFTESRIWLSARPDREIRASLPSTNGFASLARWSSGPAEESCGNPPGPRRQTCSSRFALGVSPTNISRSVDHMSSAGPYSKSGSTYFLKWRGKGFGCTGERCTPQVKAFHRSKHLLEDLFERAFRCYEWLVPTLDVLAECFEQRDALGSHDEYSEDVWSEPQK